MTTLEKATVLETRLTVGKAFKVFGGGTPSTSVSTFWQGSIPWITSADLDDDLKIKPRKQITKEAVASSATNLVPAGSVIVATRVGLGKVGVAETPLCFSQDCQGLIIDTETCDPKFVALQLKQRVQIFRYISRGTTINGVTKKQLLDLPFELPPLSTQRTIVAEIEKQFSRLDEAVASLKRTQANLKRYKAAVLKAAVEGRLTEEWRKQHPDVEPANKLLERILAERRAKWRGKGKYKEPASPDTADLPSLPRGWTWATVEQLASGLPGSIQSGPFGSHLLHSEFVDEGVLAIGIDNILDGKFSLGSQHRITPQKFEVLRKFEARPRDVVITVMATVGRVCVLPHNLERAIITKHCYRVSPAGEAVDSDYLEIALRAESSTRQHIFGNVRGQTRPGINGPILKAAPVALPPTREQQQIVAEVERRLSVIEELEATVEANLTRADRLRQSVLQQAFCGRLTLEPRSLGSNFVWEGQS